MKNWIVSVILLQFFCGRGPAEDRGKRECNDAKMQVAGTLKISAEGGFKNNSSNTGNGTEMSNETLIHLVVAGALMQCNDPWGHDSILDRYYRGYIEGKK